MHNESFFTIADERIRNLEERIEMILKYQINTDIILKSYFSPMNIPPYYGLLRDVHICMLDLLKYLDKICEENEWVYWLAFGSMLGAVRNGGFMPWDNDADTCMLRDDLEKLVDFFKNNNSSYGMYFTDNLKLKRTVCRLYNKKLTKKVFIDIYPVDKVNVDIDFAQQVDTTKKLKAFRKKEMEKFDGQKQDLYKRLRSINNEFFEIYNNKGTQKMLVYGVDYTHKIDNYFIPYDCVFPLQRISFEGVNLCVPCNYNYILSHFYGDYMSFPKFFSQEKSNVSKFKFEEIIKINKFLKRYI